jgi:hypothetical protein
MLRTAATAGAEVSQRVWLLCSSNQFLNLHALKPSLVACQQLVLGLVCLKLSASHS